MAHALSAVSFETDLEVDVSHVAIHPSGSVAKGYGNIVGGEPVAFIGDPAILKSLAAVIEDSGEVVRVVIPRWLVLP